MTRRRPSPARPTRQRRSSGKLERSPSARAAITPLGFSSFKLVPLGPVTDGEAPYATMRMLETRGAMGAFMRNRR